VDGIDVPEETDLQAGLESADLVALLQAHSAFDLGEIERHARVLFDTRGVATTGERL